MTAPLSREDHPEELGAQGLRKGCLRTSLERRSPGRLHAADTSTRTILRLPYLQTSYDWQHPYIIPSVSDSMHQDACTGSLFVGAVLLIQIIGAAQSCTSSDFYA